MDMRVTPQSIAGQAIANAQEQYAQLARTQQEASTGNRILAPSDDPFGLLQVLSSRAQQQQMDSDLSNVSDATSKLNASTSSLNQVAQLLDQAQSLAVQGANGDNDATSLKALAQQVNAISGRLLSLANTQSGGVYLFGGTASTKPPFVSTTTNGVQQVVYQGADQRASSPIGQGQSVDTLYTGQEVFQSQAGDVFGALQSLSDALTNTQGLSASAQAQAISQTIGQLQSLRANVLEVVGEQGASLQNLQSYQSSLQGLQLQARTTESNIDGADLSQVIVQLQSQQNVLQLTLASSVRIMSQSLLDFLH